MERHHGMKMMDLSAHIPKGKEPHCLNIPDHYDYIHSDLIKLIKEGFESWQKDCND